MTQIPNEIPLAKTSAVIVDIDGHEARSGDLVRVLSLDPGFLALLDEEELPHHLAMLGQVHRIDEIVEDGTKASVSIEWATDDGIACGGLCLLPAEFRLEPPTGL